MSTTLTLAQREEQFEAKQKSLFDFTESRPDFNFTREEVDDIDQKQKELNDLFDELEGARKAANIALNLRQQMEARQEAAGKRKGNPAPVVHAGAGKKDAEQEVQFKSLGDMFTKSAGFTEYDSSNKFSPFTELGIDLKTLFQTSTAQSGTIGFAPEVTRVPGFNVLYKQRIPMLASLIQQYSTEQQAVKYMFQDAPTNGTAWVTEVDPTTGESAFLWEEKSVTVQKVRQSLPISDEMMEDASAIESIVNNQLMTLFSLTIDNALMNGTGSGNQILGLLQTPSIQTQARGVDPSVDAIFKAMVKIQTTAGTYGQPDNIVMNPLDWQNIRLLRTPDGIYVFGPPSDTATPRLWGLPVQSNLVIAQGTALVGDFAQSTGQYNRKGLTMSVSTEYNNAFIKGFLTIKLEARLALVTHRPAGFCTVTGL